MSSDTLLRLASPFLLLGSALSPRPFAWAGDTVPLPTPEEIQAAYQQNFTALMPIGIRYRLAQTEGVGLVERDRQFLAEQEVLMQLKPEQLSSPGVAIEYFRQLINSAPQRHADLVWRLKPEVVERRLHEPMVRHFYFWTDRNSYHLRFPRQKGDDGIALQAGPVTPNNLMDSYQKVQMISWSKSNAPPMRFWLGTENNPPGPGGRVGDSVLEKMESTSGFGPVGFTNEQWARRYSWSELDAFMSIEPNRCKVIGTETLNGRPMLVVDGSPRGWNDTSKDSSAKPYKRIRAWIDPRQGYLPLRLEESDLDKSGVPAFQASVTEVTEVRKIGEAYYPAKGKRQEFVPDPRPELERQKKLAQQVAEQKLATGTTPQAPPSQPPPQSPPLPLTQLPGWTKLWEVSEIEPNKILEESALKLEFPVGTLYLDTTTNKWSRTGSSEAVFRQELARQKAREQEEAKDKTEASVSLPHSRGTLIGFVLANAAMLILAAAVAVAVRRRRQLHRTGAAPSSTPGA